MTDNHIKNHLLQTPSDIEQSSTKSELTGQDFHEQPELSYRIPDPMWRAALGGGGFSIVYRANDIKTGQEVALKKSRVSIKVKRTSLRHESRILQMLQGHPAIPTLYGYGQFIYFEYISMERLGDSVREKATGTLTVITVVRIVEQAISALEHVHKHGLVHRDIKPDNLLCSINDPSKIMLIDFGLTKRTTSGPPGTYDPIKEKKKDFVGTLDFASLNSHRGIDLGPGDDFESLAYTALFLLRGILPWHNLISFFNMERSQRRIYEVKISISSSQLFTDCPDDFAYLLDYSRGLDYHQMPDYNDLTSRFSRLVDSLGGYTKSDAIDWTSIPVSKPDSAVSNSDSDDDSEESGHEDQDRPKAKAEEDYDSYGGGDLVLWGDLRQGARDVSLTLPAELEELEDSQIPRICSVYPC